MKNSILIPLTGAVLFSLILANHALADAPTAIAEVLATNAPAPFCDTKPKDLDEQQRSGPAATIEGRVTAHSGSFAASYGNAGFQLSDGTAGIFVLTERNLDFEDGDRVRVSGKPCIQSGTRALRSVEVTELDDKGPVAFAPRQIGQFEKRPEIQGSPEVVSNWCNCSAPASATEGLVITVRGTAVADLEQDGAFGYKLFLDDGTGVGQIFIDAQSGIPAEELAEEVLREGNDLCATGVIARFAGVGFELLPRTSDDLREARPDRENPCRD
ncbi:MAG: hypothetical protein OSB70_19970 [Myxococcota bacterium]|nr:hypothetical protein [Myxococcota bacterium]